MPFPDNHARFNGLAKPLKKIRKTKENVKFFGHATIDAFNNRQTMRCKETRPKKHSDTVYIAPVEPDVIRELPSHIYNAYRAKELNSQAAHQPLYDLLLVIICELCKQEQWAFYTNKENPQLECLASLVLYEFLHPAKFKKQSAKNQMRFSIKALADEMHMDRRTYHPKQLENSWHQRFLSLRPIIQKWYEDGMQQVRFR